jgi:hypothetical protein
MLQREVELMDQVKKLHFELVTRMHELELQVKQGKTPIPEMVDFAFACREYERYANDMKKEASKLQQLIAKVVTMLWVIDASSERIETDYCTCEPQMRVHASVPSFSKDFKRYQTVLSNIGVPQEIIAAGVLDTNWERLGDFLTEKTKNGLPLPEGIDPERTYTVYRLSMRVRKQRGWRGLPAGVPGLLDGEENVQPDLSAAGPDGTHETGVPW